MGRVFSLFSHIFAFDTFPCDCFLLKVLRGMDFVHLFVCVCLYMISIVLFFVIFL